jgi:hypothetical protein
MAVAATLIDQAVRLLRSTSGGERRLAPAAVRVERSRFRGGHGEVGEQTALTLWFGDGPALPAPGGSGRGWRLVTGAAAVMLGAAAVGALGALAAQQQAPALEAARAQPRRISG